MHLRKSYNYLKKLHTRLFHSLAISSFLLIILLSTTHPVVAGNATLTWDPPSTNVDGSPLTDLAGYKVYYGTASETYSSIIDTGNVTTYTLSDLVENTTYFFAVTAYDTLSNESAYSNEVSKIITDTAAPVISAVSTLNISSSDATITWMTDEASTSQVEYGTNTSYGSLTNINTDMVTSHSVTISGLSAWNTYHFRVKSQDAAGNLAVSGDFSFTTLVPPDNIGPTGTILINNGDAYTNSKDITLTLSCSDPGSGCGQMQLSNDGITWSTWEAYVTTKSWVLTTGNETKTVYVKYKDNASNISLNYSDTIILDTTTPTLSGIGAGSITSTTTIISWTTDESSTTQVEYGATTSYGLTTAIDTNLLTNHSVSLTGLTPSTTYHYRVKSRDTAGNLNISSDYTFNTAPMPDTTEPVISDIGTSNITSNGSTIKWTTDEPATSQVEYGTSVLYGNFSNLDSNLTTSHTVILSGLAANTVYHFRVISVDVANNKSTSSEYTFSTLKITQPDTPASIMDLRVKAGASTRNSVTLEWTATGADGTEGTASLYDLRMSNLKIIEDGVTPLNGEINFSKADIITGLSIPKVAGTTESFQLGQLETNTVYYFAIKAKDEKGNISAISNVINSDKLPPLPVTAIRRGYTMISLPLNPTTTDVQGLLGAITGGPVELYQWSSNGFEDSNGSFTLINSVSPGRGYFIKSDIDTAVINITGSAITDASWTIALQPGWNMIGNPYPTEIDLINTYIKDVATGELKNYEDAVIAGWVGNAIYNYNGSTYDFSMYFESKLKLWQGYWIAVLQAKQYEMIIYKP